MKKLTLDIDDLQVESFDVDGGGSERGTVMGRQLTRDVACNTQDYYYCSQQPTLNALDVLCAFSEGGGYCTAVCPTGYEVCDTVGGTCATAYQNCGSE